MLDRLRNPYFILLLLWLVSIFLTYISSNGFVAAITIFFTGLLPFIYIVLWLAISKTGISVRGYFSKWHAGVLLAWFLFSYSLFAKQWAAALLNEVFHVDPNSLGITYALLAALFAPFGLLYQQSLLASMWITFLIVGVCVTGILPILLILPVAFKKLAKFTLLTFVVVFLSSVFLGVCSNLSLNKRLLVERFALWADFSEHTLCDDDWASMAESVLFLGGDRVLAYFPKNPKGTRFVPQTCDFAKTL